MADPVSPDENTPTDDAASAALKAAMDAVSGLRTETEDAGGDSSSKSTSSPEAPSDTDVPASADSAVSDQPATATPPPSPPAATADSVNLPEFSPPQSGQSASGIDLLSQVNLNVRIELGRTKMLVEDVLRLNEGSVVELDKLAGDPVDVYVNDRLVARGEVLVLNSAFSVRINEIVNR